MHQEAGAARLANLVDKGSAFRGCFTHPKVLAAIAHGLEYDLQLSSLNARPALLGQGPQAMHVDWGTRVEPGDYQVCNSIWLLDDFTARKWRHARGARQLPVCRGAGRCHAGPEGPASRRAAPPGAGRTVFVFNSHTWHGGTLNRTQKPAARCTRISAYAASCSS